MIKGTVGRGGAGKSYCTIKRLWALHKNGRDIISNTPLVDLRVRWHKGRSRWLPVDPLTFGLDWAEGYIQTWEDVWDADNCEVLIDEAGAWCPSHKYKSMPEEVRRFLAQDRREGVNIHWTHRTTRVFHELLENTAEIVRCQRFGPFIVAKSFDPEEKDGKPLTKLISVSPSVFDLYQTFARVGDGLSGEGYGVGRRKGYKVSGSLILLTNYGPHGHDLYVRREHLECLQEKFGSEYLGVLEHEEQKVGPVLQRRVAEPVLRSMLPRGLRRLEWVPVGGGTCHNLPAVRYEIVKEA